MTLRYVLALGAAMLFVGGAAAASGRQTIRLDGSWDPVIAPDLARVNGRFEANGKFCSRGSFENDQTGTPDLVKSFTRTFTCDDGSGSIKVRGVGTSEDRRGSKGRWHIAQGQGRYARLRGRGTWRITAAGLIDFTSSWTGVTDFDTAPPRVRIVRAHAALRAQRQRRYTVTVVFRARDNVSGNAVSYAVSAFAGGRHLARAGGKVRGGEVVARLVVRPARVRAVRVDVAADDPVGNRALASRRVALPS
jgi:hypothetical protein